MSQPLLSIGVITIAGLLAFGVLGCEGNADSQSGGLETVRREGEPDLVRSQNNELLDRARLKAQATYLDFVAALSQPQPQQSGFAIKKPFPTPAGSLEHIWINELTWNGTQFEGVVNNEPVDTTAVALGERVTIAPTELSDWMYLDGDKLQGGYTIRALTSEMTPSERKEFGEQNGMVVPPVDF